MKLRVKFSILSCLTMLVLGHHNLSAQGLVFTEPVKYNDYIVTEQNKIGESILAFVAAVSGETIDGTALWNAQKALVAQTQDGIQKVKALPGYDGDTGLRDAAVKLFEYYLITSQTSYKEIIEILIRGEFTAAELARMDELVAKVTQEEAAFDAQFQSQQQVFAKKYNIILSENQLMKKLD